MPTNIEYEKKIKNRLHEALSILELLEKQYSYSFDLKDAISINNLQVKVETLKELLEDNTVFIDKYKGVNNGRKNKEIF